MSHKINDGAHRHSRESKTIMVPEEGMRLVAEHLPFCPKCPEITIDSHVPLQFIVEKDGSGSVVCGYCQKNLGRCNVREVK